MNNKYSIEIIYISDIFKPKIQFRLIKKNVIYEESDYDEEE